MNQKGVKREFKEGNVVLILSPMNKEEPFEAMYQSPYVIEKKVSMVKYVISTLGHRWKTELCHINRLKGYLRRSENKPVMALQETTQKDEEGYYKR